MRAAVIAIGLVACGGSQAKSRPLAPAPAVDAGTGSQQLARDEDDLRAVEQRVADARQALDAAHTDAERAEAQARLDAVTRERDELADRVRQEKLDANPLYAPLDDDR